MVLLLVIILSCVKVVLKVNWSMINVKSIPAR